MEQALFISCRKQQTVLAIVRHRAKGWNVRNDWDTPTRHRFTQRKVSPFIVRAQKEKIGAIIPVTEIMMVDLSHKMYGGSRISMGFEQCLDIFQQVRRLKDHAERGLMPLI